MSLVLVGHGDVVEQVKSVLKADPTEGPLAVARIKAVMRAYDDDVDRIAPGPIAQYGWSEGVSLKMRRGPTLDLSRLNAKLVIYIYEKWRLRFGLAKLSSPGDAIVCAFLMVETQVAADAGLTSGNLCHALLTKAEEITWPN